MHNCIRSMDACALPLSRICLGVPPQVAKPEDSTVLTLDDNRTRRKNTPGDQSMRRSIQDLVSSIDPHVKIEPEVEDVRPPSTFCVCLVSLTRGPVSAAP